MARSVLSWVSGYVYRATVALLWPFNALLAVLLRSRYRPRSVLHVSYMVHIAHLTVESLREAGIDADYLALGTSKVWNKSDYQLVYRRNPVLRALQEFYWLWAVVARYEILHSHFMLTPTSGGWCLPWLKRMGRKLLVHYRGCDARYRDLNLKLFPQGSICEECDYGRVCLSKTVVRQRRAAERWGDAYVVTTPDLLDFAPRGAVHLPFFAPHVAASEASSRKAGVFKIVHVTNHPGIEGSRQIEAAVARLKSKGYAIEYVFLKGVGPDRVEAEYATADLAIGKMKMGYYANSQIESMALGVPTVTYVRPEFMTPELEASGFIFTDLAGLESTLERYLSHPEELARKRAAARASIFQLHDNRAIARRLAGIYEPLFHSAGGTRDAS